MDLNYVKNVAEFSGNQKKDNINIKEKLEALEQIS